MQVWRSSTSRLTRQRYDLTSLDLITYLYHILGVMAIVGFHSVGMADTHQIAVARKASGKHDLAIKSRTNLVVGLGLQVHTRMAASSPSSVVADDLGSRKREAPLLTGYGLIDLRFLDNTDIHLPGRSLLEEYCLRTQLVA